MSDRIEAAIRADHSRPTALRPDRRQHRSADQRHQHGLHQFGHRSAPSDADMLITLNDGRDAEADGYVKAMRETLPQKFPGTTFAFLPADIVTQILNFGLPAPIDVQIIGSELDANRAYAKNSCRRIARVPGDRRCAHPAGLQRSDTRRRIRPHPRGADRRAQRSATSPRACRTRLSGSIQTAPTFWLNPKNGVSYPIVAQTPQYWLNSMSSASRTFRPRRKLGQANRSAAWRPSKRGVSNAVVSHYAVQPVIDIYATNNDRDLGAVAADIQKIRR